MVGFVGILVVKDVPGMRWIEMVIRSVPPWLVAFLRRRTVGEYGYGGGSHWSPATLANDLFRLI
jgi:hypothetical protein